MHGRCKKREKSNLCKKVCLPLATFILSACGPTEFKSAVSPAEKISGNSDAEATLGRKRKSAKEYLDNFYSQQKPTIGIAHIRNNEVPVVSPIAVMNPDIVFQIYRCDSRQTIEGVVDAYDDKQPELSSKDFAKAYFSKNRFWNDVVRKCARTADSHAQSEFLDSSAPSGSFRWLTRACLISDRPDQPVCSDVVFASDVLPGYRNNFSDQQQQLLERINNKMQLISGISSSFPERARQLAIALDSCGQAEWNKAARQLIRSLLLDIIGMGSAIVFEIFGPTETVTKTWSEKAQMIWQPTADVQKSGQAVTRILSWLFTNQHDFKEACSAAEEIRTAAASEVLRLQSLQVALASDLDDADRLELPLPREVQR
ncbi:hypothetical protein EBR21_06370 [bacterium]|nr:hypothetical protein [bacterium]